MESLRGSNRAASLKMKRKEGEKVKQKEKTVRYFFFKKRVVKLRLVVNVFHILHKQGSRNEDIAKPAQKRKGKGCSLPDFM